MRIVKKKVRTNPPRVAIIVPTWNNYGRGIVEGSPLELYHLKTDPQERTNLAATNKQMFNELSAALHQHIQRGGATPWQKPPPGSSP
jgi:hypothetical protein